MASREEYHLNLKCPNCGREGTADVSEAANPIGGLRFRIDAVPEGFTVKRTDDSGRDSIIWCADCSEQSIV